MPLPGGAVYTLEASPVEPWRVWAAGRAALFTSGAYGQGWSYRSDRFDLSPDRLLLEPSASDPWVLYMLDGRQGVYRSNDAGTTWRRVDDGSLREPGARALRADPFVPGALFVASDRGVWISRDDGASWELADGPAGAVALAPSRVEPGVVWAVTGTTERPVWRSDDHGATWQALTAPIFGRGEAIAVDDTTSGTAWAAIDGRVFQTLDGGASWIDLALPGAGRVLDLERAASALWAVVEQRLFERRDQGTWTEVAIDSTPILDVEGLGRPPNGVLVATATGIRLRRGERWERPEVEPPTQEVARLEVGGAAEPPWVFAGTATDGLYRGTAEGWGWERIDPAAPHAARVTALALAPSRPGTLFVALDCAAQATCPAAARGRIYRSDCDGCSWEPADGGLPAGLHVEDLVVHPADDAVVWAGSSGPEGAIGMWLSRDGGASWRLETRGLAEGTSVPRVVAIGRDEPFTIYLGTSSGEVYRWTPSTESWDLRLRRSQPSTVTALATGTGGEAYAATVGGRFMPQSVLHRTQDGGDSWSRGAQQSLVQMTDVAVSAGAPGEVWLATRPLIAALAGGLQRSRDAGVSFEQVAARAGLAVIALEPARHEGVWLGTHAGLYRWVEPCAPDADTLCLMEGRYEIEGSWRNPYDGSSGRAGVQRHSQISGLLWFTDPANPEVAVKLMDFGGDEAVFYGQLTDLEFEFRLLDTLTGHYRVYRNTPGNCGGTERWGSIASSTRFGSGNRAQRPPRALRPGCRPDAETLCLLGGRLRVRGTWHHQYISESGTMLARPHSHLAGWLSFQHIEVPELMVKALDFGDRLLFYWGALTDLEYTLVVEDLETGGERRYHSRPRAYCGGFDPVPRGGRAH